MNIMMGFGSLLLIIALPVAAVCLLIWTYQIKRNSDIQVEQNHRIIQMLEKFQKENA